MKTAAPPTYPIKAINDIFFRYQPNDTPSNPIKITPAADPITKILPPTPAQYARKCQKVPSTTKFCIKAALDAVVMVAGSITGYIPMAAATNGTLSTMEDKMPIVNPWAYTLGMCCAI